MNLNTRIEVWAITPSCGLGDRAQHIPPRGTPRSWLICHTVSLSDHWPSSGVCRHRFGCRVGGLLIRPHDRLLVVPCLGVPQIAGRGVVGDLARTPGRWS
jgi:hypothetical protein